MINIVINGIFFFGLTSTILSILWIKFISRYLSYSS
jgi:hypothetical protein